eukprot:370931-Rhodomonas_salina.2
MLGTDVGYAATRWLTLQVEFRRLSMRSSAFAVLCPVPTEGMLLTGDGNGVAPLYSIRYARELKLMRGTDVSVGGGLGSACLLSDALL